MIDDEIIKCKLTGYAYASNNTIYLDVREYYNEHYVVLNLEACNFILYVDAGYRKIKDCTFNEYTGQYELTTFVNLSNAKFLVLSLYDQNEMVNFVIVDNKIYEGVSNSIKVCQ